MQKLQQALDEMKGLHQQVLGWPPPELGPQSFFPFPPGIDPVKHALLEVKHLKELAEQFARAPKPGAWIPPADVWLTKDEFIVRLEVPGVPHDELDVFVVANECVVRGERKPHEKVDEWRPVAIERPFGPFERRFSIPTGCQPEEMKAKATDGVLELRIPLHEVEAPKEQKVEVK